MIGRFRKARHRPLELPGITTAGLAITRAAVTGGPLWVADLREVEIKASRLYLAVVLDGRSGECLGWAFSDRLSPALVIEALEIALLSPTAGAEQRPAPVALAAPCRLAGIRVPRQSFAPEPTRRVAERFFALAERDLVMARGLITSAGLQEAISEWIASCYNRYQGSAVEDLVN